MKLLKIFFILSLLMTQAVYAVDVKVMFTKGSENYLIDENENAELLKKHDYLIEGQAISVGHNGLAILKIDGHSNIRVEENTKMLISQLPYFYQESKELEQEANFLLEMGTVLIDMVKTFDSKALTIKTKNTILGVRGTSFLVSRNNQEGDNVLLSVNNGLVEAENKKSGQNDFVGKEESLVIEKDRNFTQKQKYSFQGKIDWDATKPPKRTFRDLRKGYQREFKQRRKKWKPNKNRVQKLKRAWLAKNRNWEGRVKSLKKSPQRMQRMERIRHLKKLHKEKKKLRPQKAKQALNREKKVRPKPKQKLKKLRRQRNQESRKNRRRRSYN